MRQECRGDFLDQFPQLAGSDLIDERHKGLQVQGSFGCERQQCALQLRGELGVRCRLCEDVLQVRECVQSLVCRCGIYVRFRLQPDLLQPKTLIADSGNLREDLAAQLRLETEKLPMRFGAALDCYPSSAVCSTPML